ncbi:MAG: hypothetical protein ACI89E_002212 [Planctomycetota bacterium]|jgi:hypothetical protein
MKQFLTGLFATAGVFALFTLLSASPAPALVRGGNGITQGTTLRSLNLIKGTGGGFAAVSADTPVTVVRVEGDWILVDYPAQVGGDTWLNQSAIISYQVRL